MLALWNWKNEHPINIERDAKPVAFARAWAARDADMEVKILGFGVLCNAEMDEAGFTQHTCGQNLTHCDPGFYGTEN